MTACKHTQWLRLSRNGHDHALEVSDSAARLLDTLPSPDNQFPSVISVFGNHSKAHLLQKFGICVTGPKGKRGHGELHLFVSPSTSSTNSPMLVVDGDIPQHNRLGKPWKPQSCHEVSIRPIVDPEQGKAVRIANSLHHRLLLPFIDVVCFFATDIGGIDRVVAQLVLWVGKGLPSTSKILPQLLVIVDDGREAEVSAAFSNHMRSATSLDLVDYFSGIRFFSLKEPTGSRKHLGQSRARSWKELQRLISDASQRVLQSRSDASCLFSARHLAGFMQHAAVRASEPSAVPFNFIRISRLESPIALDLETHIAQFLSRCQTLRTLKSFALPMLTSSFILDHYPPGMHLFDPLEVYITLYKEACISVSHKVVLIHEGPDALILPSALTNMIAEEFREQFNRFLSQGSSVDQHRRVIAGFRREWAHMYSDETCFCCIRRRPQVRLPCGHAFCENCIKVFGLHSPIDPWLFSIDRCFLCDEAMSDIRVKIKPDTASVRILSIDGGGTRGRAPLEFIRVLQQRIGLPYPVQNHFDVVYGTSSGAIIAFALFVNGWPVEDCIASFENLARLAFKRRPSCRVPVLSKIFGFLLSLLVDSRYPSKNLEAALKTVFGARSLMDYSKATETGAMVGVPVTTVRDVTPCIFTNYNGVGQREENTGYHVLPTRDDIGRVALWEMLRCATAAPYHFKPHHIKGLGSFQDGGLAYNNPASLAIEEAAVIFPHAPRPSLVVSLGTGSPRENPPDNSRSRRLWRDSFLARVFRAFWQYGSSKRAWQLLLSHQKGRQSGDFFRFDVEFDGPEPRLDEVTVMKELEGLARAAMLESPALDQLALRIRAELFVFELDPISPFRLVKGIYEGIGRISCRLRAKTAEFDAFISQLAHCSAMFLVGDRALPGDFLDCSTKLEDGNYSRAVSFRATSRLDPITICLRENDVPCPISGAPFTIQGLIDAQKLEARFGTAEHSKRKWRDGDERQRKRIRRW